MTVSALQEDAPGPSCRHEDWTFLRGALGLTVEELAHWAGLSSQSVRVLERGAGSHTTAREALAVLAGFLAGAESARSEVVCTYTRLAESMGEPADLDHVCPLPHGW
jgi:hypothetical protein